VKKLSFLGSNIMLRDINTAIMIVIAEKMKLP